ncbi:MAG: hypothetical protein WBP82_08430, partial [Leuconostoc mesenteroides]
TKNSLHILHGCNTFIGQAATNENEITKGYQMSKSAIKLLSSANEILAALDLTIGNPASWMKDEQARNQFKNADLLACLIIDSAANALICENADTLDENMYDDMQQAVEGYIQSNLDTWSQAELKKVASLCDVKALLAKLLDAVAGQRAYAERQKAHAEALEINEIITQAVEQNTRMSGNAYTIHHSVSRAVEQARGSMLALNRYTAREIVKVMIAVSRLTKEANIAAQAKFATWLESSNADGCDDCLPF